MIYTIDRDTPLGNDLKKVPVAELKAIAATGERTGDSGICLRVSVMDGMKNSYQPAELGTGTCRQDDPTGTRAKKKRT